MFVFILGFHALKIINQLHPHSFMICVTTFLSWPEMKNKNKKELEYTECTIAIISRQARVACFDWRHAGNTWPTTCENLSCAVSRPSSPSRGPTRRRSRLRHGSRGYADDDSVAEGDRQPVAGEYKAAAVGR